MKKDNKNNLKKWFPCYLQVYQNKGYYNLVLLTENNTQVEIKVSHYNKNTARKLNYKLAMEVLNNAKQ